MDKSLLLSIASKLGVACDETMTVAQLESLIASANAVVTNVPPVTPEHATHASASDDVFYTMKAEATATYVCKIVFIAPTKNKLRLIVQRAGKPNEAVYAFPEIVKVAEVKAGDTIMLLVELRADKKEVGKSYWNVTALAKQ
jgi:hypothetical protein